MVKKHLCNDVIQEAIPKTRNWGLLLFGSILTGIIAYSLISPIFIPVLESAFTVAEETGLGNDIGSFKMGLLIFGKNTFVALLCLLTARITFGIYPIIVLSFNGLLIGFVSAVLVKYGGMEVLQVAAGILPHAGFELFGILLACAIGFMKIPIKVKLQSSLIVWGLLLVAATVEVTITEALLTMLS